jgi:hypothetical protein
MEIRFNPMGVNYALYVFDWEKFCAYLQEHSAGAHDAASVHIHIKRLKDCHRLRQLIGNNMDTFFKLSLKPSQNSYWRSPLNDSITSRTLIRATPQTTEFRMFHSSNTAEGYIYYIQLVLEMLRYNEDTELGMVDWISSLKDSAYPLVRKNARRVLNDNQK